MDSKSLRKMGLMCLCKPSAFSLSEIPSQDASSGDTAVTRELMTRCLLSYGFVSNVNALLLHLGRSVHVPTDNPFSGGSVLEGSPHEVGSLCDFDIFMHAARLFWLNSYHQRLLFFSMVVRLSWMCFCCQLLRCLVCREFASVASFCCAKLCFSSFSFSDLH